MAIDADIARGHVLRTFSWHGGHADLAGVFGDPATLASLGAGLTEPFRDQGVTAVIGAEARGFILGPLCAICLNTGFVPARKPGSVHPGDKVIVRSDPDWRSRRTTFRIAKILGPSDRVLIVDDWIETGSQADALARGIDAMGATLVGTSVIVDQALPAVRSALNVVGLLRHEELPSTTSD